MRMRQPTPISLHVVLPGVNPRAINEAVKDGKYPNTSEISK
jgi:hypothetical protein